MTARLDFKSVRFRTWLYFVLMSVAMLILLWSVEVLFFNFYSQSMKRQELQRNGDQLVRKFGSPNFNNVMQDAAMLNGVSIVVFAHTGQTDRIILSYANSLGSTDIDKVDEALLNIVLGERANLFYEKLGSKNSTTYIMNVSGKGNFLIYAATRKDVINLDAPQSPIFFCMLTPMVSLDSTTAVLRDQLIIVTIICLLLSVLLSFMISSRISKPITEFSKVARKLGKGDYSVRFEGNGYTEIEDLADTLNYATEEMGKTESLRRDFLANVSHDLRTPLTMVKAYAEMIRDISGDDESKRTEHAQVIIDEADRLAGLVGDILNLSKMQSGTEELALSEFDLSFIAREVLDRFSIKQEKDGYVLKSDIDANVTAYGDVKRIEQVLYNLIGNALNYTGKDKTVSIRVKGAESGKARFEVTDTGKGIPQDEIEAVWDRYYRANINKRAAVGTGLGLSIVKSILISHKAEFGIISEVGKGSTFWFELSPPPAEKLSAPKRRSKNRDKSETEGNDK